MARLPLSNGEHQAIVDDSDLPAISHCKWHLSRHKAKQYVRNGNKEYLHRFLMNPPEGMTVDHLNGDTLDNRRENLRVVSRAENNRNRQKNRNSFLKGVRRHGRKWQARPQNVYLGTFDTITEAAQAVFGFCYHSVTKRL